MQITIKHFSGQYPSFNVCLHGTAGAEPFLEIKGCRIVDGKNGEFVSWPATKNEKTGKYWAHVFAGEKFAAAVLKAAQEGKQEQKNDRRFDGAKSRQLDDDVPF